LIAVIAPFIPPGLAVVVAALGLIALVLSFATDILWLARRAAAVEHARTRRVLSVLLALVLLNGSVTFHNVWPTLAVHWPGELSVEFGVLLLTLAAMNAWRGRTPSRVLALLSVLVVLFVVGRYAYVTVQALYGRDINLYWDGRSSAQSPRCSCAWRRFGWWRQWVWVSSSCWQSCISRHAGRWNSLIWPSAARGE
jgi:hypothetical protein